MACSNDAPFESTEAGRGQKGESLIDEAKRIQFMKRQGLTIPQIADRLATNQQNVRRRLQLLRLKPEEQMRVYTGKLAMINALQMLRKREYREAPPDATDQGKPTNRKRMKTVKNAQALYAVEKPEDCDDEFWAIVITDDVRRYFAKLLGVEYTTHPDMVKAKHRDK